MLSKSRTASMRQSKAKVRGCLWQAGFCLQHAQPRHHEQHSMVRTHNSLFPMHQRINHQQLFTACGFPHQAKLQTLGRNLRQPLLALQLGPILVNDPRAKHGGTVCPEKSSTTDSDWLPIPVAKYAGNLPLRMLVTRQPSIEMGLPQHLEHYSAVPQRWAT